MYPRQQQGKDERIDVETLNFASATFQLSGHVTNLQALPFTPTFDVNSMVPGQNVYIGTPAFVNRGPYFAAATTITLMPQAIDGTVTGSSTLGNFTIYTVALAPYDLFASLASQPGQGSLLTQTGLIEVYVDSSTQMLNTSPVQPGSTLRFHGLVFDDNGTLRMDCSQVSDGVTA
jgi:hypothetical protein